MVLMMHNLRKGGAIPLDALLSIRAVAHEVTQAGYQFLISFQVSSSSQMLTLASPMGCGGLQVKQARSGSSSILREAWKTHLFPAGSYQHLLPTCGPCRRVAAFQQGTHYGTAAP